jgi:hypothetical protein
MRTNTVNCFIFADSMRLTSVDTASLPGAGLRFSCSPSLWYTSNRSPMLAQVDSGSSSSIFKDQGSPRVALLPTTTTTQTAASQKPTAKSIKVKELRT